MKPKDLMVGDWILLDGREKRIECGEDISELEHIAYSLNYNEDKISERMKPIPITIELLEKNGFARLVSLDNLGSVWKSECGRVEIDDFCSNFPGREWYAHFDSDLFETIGGADVQFVHELQHALNLFEINLKIEP